MLEEALCSIEGCSRKVKALKLCWRHYEESQGPCIVEGCRNFRRSHDGFCGTHYDNRRGRYAPRLPEPIRFWLKIKKQRGAGCWIWQGSVQSDGYGTVKSGGKTRLAHHVGWELQRGELPQPCFLKHGCSEKRCVRASHLTIRELPTSLKASSIDKFWARVEKTETCWYWKGWKESNGYGKLRLGKNQGRIEVVKAHRFAWQLEHGEVPEGSFVCHRCDVPNCVNPEHLWLGTCLENIQDMDMKGRRRTTKGYKISRNMKAEKNPHAQITWEIVHAMRARYAEIGNIAQVSREFKRSRASAYFILKGDQWKEPLV